MSTKQVNISIFFFFGWLRMTASVKLDRDQVNICFAELLWMMLWWCCDDDDNVDDAVMMILWCELDELSSVDEVLDGGVN